MNKREGNAGMDEFEISNLVYRSAELIDQFGLVEAAELFRDAQIKLHPDAEPLTATEMLALWRSEMNLQPNGKPAIGTPATRQLISNPIIHVDREQGRATCRSCYTVLTAHEPTSAQGQASLQVSACGQYRDEFILRDGYWQFSLRECLPMETITQEAAGESPTGTRQTNNQSAVSLSPQKLKILTAAQQIFSTVGYSEAGIRKIAELVDLSPTILFRQFGTKAGLFEAALIAAMGDPKPPVAREHFGEHVANLLADPLQVNCPHAMSILATGNEEAREIALRVLREYAIMPMIEWLGGPHADSRAREIMALCAGFALYNSQLNMMPTKTIDSHMVQWLARSIQAVVDENN